MELNGILVQALTDSIAETFSTVLSLPPMVQDGKCAIEKLKESGIIASIGFAGNLDGSLVLAFSNISACKAVSKMLGSEINEACQDVFDGTGEIANILIGGVKTRIANDGYTFDISIPTVIQGMEPMTVAKLNEISRVELCVNCGEFCVDVILSYNVKKK